MYSPSFLVLLGAAAVTTAQSALDWQNVHIGGGGGFITGILFHPKTEGLAYARTDIGGLYRLNAEDDSWTPVTDALATDEGWHNWGIDAVALDPQDDNVVYAAAGLYSTNTTWDTNGSIIKSSDRGTTWNFTDLPFKVGGNMPGRGNGERLAVDPKNSNILFFGARSGNGLWKSTDAGASFQQVTTFTAVGNFAQNPNDTSGYMADLQGLTFVTFDETSEATADGATSRIFAGSASTGDVQAVWVSTDAGETWSPLEGQPDVDHFAHKCKVQPSEKALYFTYSDGTGPFDGNNGSVWRYDLSNSSWKDITPMPPANRTHGFGGLGLDMQQPGTLTVAALNLWWPDVQIFRSTDSGATWSTIWNWASNGSETMERHHTISAPKAPWIEAGFMDARGNDGTLLGWMVESLEINPFNSDHMLYGTGLTMYGSKDLTNWDAVPRQNVNIESMAEGIEETAVLGLASAPGGTELLVAVGDVDGFSFRNSSDIDTPPSSPWMNPQISTTNDVDYAGESADHVVRVGNGSNGSQIQLLISEDGGFTWRPHPGVTDNGTYGGLAAFSADASTIVWSSWSRGVLVSHNESTFVNVTSLEANAVIASDKRNATVFYAASPKGAFFVSTDKGVTFATAGSLGNATSVIDIAAHPAIEGELYVSTNVGVFKSTNYGATFELLASTLTNTQQIALGLASADGSSWNIYAFGTGPAGKRLYASLDGGASWTDIQGDAQGFGTIVSEKCKLAGSGSVPGRVYVGTNGRGVFYGTVGGGAAAAETTNSAYATAPIVA